MSAVSCIKSSWNSQNVGIPFSKIVFFPLIILSLFYAATCFSETYEVNTANSSIGFFVKRMGITYVEGRFTSFSGKINLVNKGSGDNFIEITIEPRSVDTGNNDWNAHLMGPDFFDTQKYPTISFKSRAVKRIEGPDYQMKGDMTLHGVTNSVTVQVRKKSESFGRNRRVAAETTFKIKRSDYGMNTMLGTLGDNVEIKVIIEAFR